MTLKDKPTPAQGIFSICVRDKSGCVVYADTDHNMIVTGARAALALLISSADANKMISRFGVGIGTAAATVNDTALVSQYLKSLDGYDVSVAGQVTFHWSLGFSEANGMTISEFGLFCADDTLFAHKVRGGIVKEEDLSFEGDWTIVF